MKIVKKQALAVCFAAVVGAAIAQTPSSDPQTTLSTAATQNSTSAYNAGTAYYDQQAYQAAVSTAQNISNQDAANSSYGSDAWQQAADQAQSVANDNQIQADDQIPIQQQNQTSEDSAYGAEVTSAPAVAQSNSDTAQTTATASATSSLAGISGQTGIPQGQITPGNDTSYWVAGAATQALMNKLSTDGYQSNIDAVQAAQQAAIDAADQDYGGAAYEMSVNAAKQSEANADYAANTAAAPVIAGALNAAAAASAISSATNSLQQIQTLTGVQQGQTGGAANIQDALRQTTIQTGVETGQSGTVPSNDTSYTGAADVQQASLNATSQQNENDTWTAAQAWQSGLSAQYSKNAADNISQYDNSMATSTSDPTWTQAASIAQQAVDQQQSIYDTQQSIETSATNDGNTTYGVATAAAPGIGNTLDTVAGSAAAVDAAGNLQQIGAATGVAQNGP